jgi:hypothetical protein
LVKVGWDEEKILDHPQAAALYDSIIIVHHNWVYADHFPLGEARDILDPPDRA